MIILEENSFSKLFIQVMIFNNYNGTENKPKKKILTVRYYFQKVFS